MAEDAAVLLGEAFEPGSPLDRHPKLGQVRDQHALVLVLREREHEREGTEPLAEMPELGLALQYAGPPHRDVLDLDASANHLVGETELAVEFQRPGMDAHGP